MAKYKQISKEKRAQIQILHEAGHSHRKIANLVGVSKYGVQQSLRRFAETKTFDDRKRSGRPKKTSKLIDRLILVTSKRDRFKTAPEIAAEVNKIAPQKISNTTVKRRLNSNGMWGRVAIKKPLLRPVNKLKRLEFALKHKDWTIEQWKNVFWTDESKFELFGNKRRQYVRRKVGESHLQQCVAPSFKYGGGSVMVWGGFSYDGVGELVKIDGKMDQNYYHRLLSQHIIPSGLSLLGNGFIFQQDNDPKHTSKLCQNYLLSKQSEGILKVMEWPPQSPDVNPIELLWDELDRQIRQMHITSKKTMWECLNRAWNNFAKETLQNLVHRMPRICAAIIKSRGGYFNEKTLN